MILWSIQPCEVFDLIQNEGVYHCDLVRVKPDLRALRWLWGDKKYKYYRLEIDIPDELVLLSDYNAWSVMLNEGLLADTWKLWKEQIRSADMFMTEGKR